MCGARSCRLVLLSSKARSPLLCVWPARAGACAQGKDEQGRAASKPASESSQACLSLLNQPPPNSDRSHRKARVAEHQDRLPQRMRRQSATMGMEAHGAPPYRSRARFLRTSAAQATNAKIRSPPQRDAGLPPGTRVAKTPWKQWLSNPRGVSGAASRA